MFQLLGWEVDTVTRVVGLVEDRKKKTVKTIIVVKRNLIDPLSNIDSKVLDIQNVLCMFE